MRFYTENIIHAIKMAIKQRQEIEKKMGYSGDSGMLSNWKMFLAELEKYESVNV